MANLMFPVKSRSALELWCNVFQIIGLLVKSGQEFMIFDDVSGRRKGL